MSTFLSADDSNELDLKDEGGIWWNNSTSSLRSIGIVWWAGQDCFLSDLKLWDSLIPSSDDSSSTNLELEWLSS
jgi:hypothetical protein